MVNGLIVVAQSGWTSEQLLTAMVRLPQQLWRDVLVVTLCIGGNDLKQLIRRHLFSPNRAEQLPLEDVKRTIVDTSNRLHEICHELSRHKVPYVHLATLYNPVPQSELARMTFTHFNRMMTSCAKQFGFRVVDLHHPFQGHEANCIDGYKQGRLQDIVLPFRRPIHPNDEGHRVITEQFVAAFAQNRSENQPIAKKTKSPSKRTKHRRPNRAKVGLIPRGDGIGPAHSPG